LRILVAEDNKTLAAGLVSVLRADGYAVDHVIDGGAALAVIRSEQVDLMILDLNLPDIDGLDVLRQARQEANSPSILILSARAGLEDRVKGLDLGADDYMVKPFDVDELEARIRMLIRRRAGLKRSMIQFGPLTYDVNSRTVSVADAVLTIPAREIGLLETLILRAGKVATKQSIIESLAGFDDELSENAVEQYVSRLRRRLQPHGVTVRTARGVGYFLEKSPG